MNWRQAILACGLVGLPLALGGCVAAAAIPVLAAGGVITRDRGGEQAAAEDKPPLVEVASQAEVAAAAPAPPAAEASPQTEPMSEGDPAAASEITVTGQSVVVAQASSNATATVVAASFDAPVAAFALYTHRQAERDPVSEPRKSAILATVGSLVPETGDCGIRPAAVLIDLDPGKDRFAADMTITPEPSLAYALERMRLHDVAVHWVAAAPAIEAGRLRQQLISTGLDPAGRDRLLLMRRADDSKEVRRRELAQTHCVVAILGDTRSDFDELFDYLRNPAAATQLDELIGNGWFLAPSLTSATKD